MEVATLGEVGMCKFLTLPFPPTHPTQVPVIAKKMAGKGGDDRLYQ